MADDRLYLVCPDCKGSFLLAKSFGYAWSARNYSSRQFDEALDEFFEAHLTCDTICGQSHEFILANEKKLCELRHDLEVTNANAHDW